MSETDDQRLRALAEEVLSGRGVSAGDISFSRTKDFNFRWSLHGKVLDLHVSDYLDTAPDEVLRQFIRGASTFIFGGKHVFGSEYLDYVRSDKFILEKRPAFFARSRRLTRSDVGQYRNLFDSVDRLLDMGLLFPEDIDNTLFTWTAGSNTTRLGYCAQMFRVVAISGFFDDPSVPERLLDYVVYHECLHLRQGYRPFNHNPHDAEFKRQERMFPDQAEVETELRKILKK